MVIKKNLSRHLGMHVVDYFRKTNAVSQYVKLKEYHECSLEELETLQFKNVRQLLTHCRGNVPYYRDLFKQYKFDPNSMSSLKDLKVLPVLTKDEIRNNFERLKATNFEQYVPRIKETGGSTGEPLKMYHDKESHGAMWANIYSGFGNAGYSLGDKFLILAHGSMLPKKIKKSQYFYYLFQNASIFPSYHLTHSICEEFIQEVKKCNAKYIYGYSSSLHQIAKQCYPNRFEFPSLRAIFTTADMLYPKQRSLIEKVFNVPVYDNYGCPEAGVMTWECSEHNGYHCNMETAYIEIDQQDTQGNGRIISTNLTNYAFPIIRYDTNDIGKIDESSCDCGRAHIRISSLIGRQRDIITLPNGNMIHGAFFNHLPALYDTRIQRFQIIQIAIDVVEIHIEFRGDVSLSDFEHLKVELGEVLGADVTINLIEDEFEESGVSKKHRSVVSAVDNHWTGCES